ncbi:MAG: hypothetical protein FJ147_08855 [Deltaproteobacteria bacterium]|nr:hypothetical protein [Deltaproteobacteria bacterium]
MHVQSKGDNRSQIVGRAAEIAYLEQCLETALTGERQVVFISGEPGIGKTTIVEAFRQRLEARGLGLAASPQVSSLQPLASPVSFAYGQCIEQYGAGEAFMPLLEIAGQLCRGPQRDQTRELLRRYAPSWLVQLPFLIDAAELEALHRQLQGATRERMLREAAEILTVFTREQGLVMVLEDLHWSDISTLEWLSYVAQRREPAKLLIIGTYRPTDVLANNHPLRGVVQELTARSRCEELRVTPLSEQAVNEYLTQRLHTTIAASPLPELIHRRTGGNPLFIVNVVDDLLQQGLVREQAGQWTMQGDVLRMTENVPNTLRHIIEKQFQHLPEETQHLLEVASVVGIEFSAAAVAAGLQVEVEEVDRQCDMLVRRGQLITARGTEEWPDGTLSERYRFHHALYHAVLYDRVNETRRIRLHRRVGEQKEAAYGSRASEIAAELAVRFTQGREVEKAIAFREHAGQTALRRHANQEAVVHFTQGLELLITLPETAARGHIELRLQLALVNPLRALKGYTAPEVEHVYARVRGLCQQEEQLPQFAATIGGLIVLHHTRAEFRTAWELGAQFLTLSQRLTDPLLTVRAYMQQGTTLYDFADLPTARQYLQHAYETYDWQTHADHIAQYGGRDPGVGSLHWLALTLWRLGYADQALHCTQQALALAEKLAHPFTLAWSHYVACVIHYYRREVESCLAHVRITTSLAQEHGFGFIITIAAISEGWAQVEQGQGEGGIAQIRHGLRLYQEAGACYGIPAYLAVLAEAYAKNGQLAEAYAAVDEAFVHAEQAEHHVYMPDLYLLKGELLLNDERGMLNDERKTREEQQEVAPIHHSSFIIHRSEEAEGYFHKALTTARQQHAKSLELRASVSLARLWQSQGKPGEARQLVEEIYSWFTEGFDTKDMQEAEALLMSLGSSVSRPKSKVQSPKPPQAEGLRPQAEGANLSSPYSLKPIAFLSPHLPQPLVPNL